MRPALERAWRALPKPLQDGIASGIDRLHGVEIPAPPIPPVVPHRIFFGPVNYAGQATQWARALERDPSIAARTMVSEGSNGFGYPVDYTVRWRTMEHSRAWQQSMLQILGDHYTHIVIEAVTPVLGGLHRGDVLRQIDSLRARGLKVWMLGHGTDVRLPSRHRELVPWSHYRDDEWTSVDAMERKTQQNLRIVDAAAAPTFVSTPGLLLDLPRAELTPVVIDPAQWTASEDVLEHPVVRVVHSPSNPVTKGSEMIAPAVERLESDGVIEFTRIEGVPNVRMPEFFAASDVFLDQFRSGDYGVAACEAMAAGRVVVSHVTEHARTVVAELTGHELPIVEATIDTLEDVLRDIAERRDHYRTIAARGPGFVKAVHDGEYSRRVFARHLSESA